MAPLLELHLLAGFIAGWILVTFVTYVGTRLGTGEAGFVGALPSTGAIGLFFIGLSEGMGAAIKSTSTFPLGFSITFIFLLFYAYPRRQAFWPRFVVAILLWFFLSAAIAVLIVSLDLDNLYVSLAGYAVISLAVYSALGGRGILNSKNEDMPSSADTKDTPEAKTRTTQVGNRVFHGSLFKGILGGVVVASVVAVSAYGGPLAGGVAGAAPAIWSSSLVLARPHLPYRDIEFSRSLAKSFFDVGVFTIIPFYVLARFIMILLSAYVSSIAGVAIGILLAYVCLSPLAWYVWHKMRLGK